MIKKFGVLLGMLLIGIAFLAAGCGSKQEAAKPAQTPALNSVLRIGAIPAEDAQKQRESYAPLVSYLEKKTGLKAELFVATDYSGVIEAMRSGKLDIALFGPFSYILAADKADAEAFVVEIRKGSGTSYKSLITTHLEDLSRMFNPVIPHIKA